MEATYRMANGRYKFLEAFKTRNPEVLKTLHDQVLPIFKMAMTRPSFLVGIRMGVEGVDFDIEGEPCPAEPGILVIDLVDLCDPELAPKQTASDADDYDALPRREMLQMQMLESYAAHPHAGDRERSAVCRIRTALQEEIRKSSNEEQWEFLKQPCETLVAGGATEMYVAVGEEVDKAPIPINPLPGEKWPEIASSSDPKLANVRAAILKWADRFNLTDAWILETVVQTLLSWMLNPGSQDRWAHSSSLSEIPQDPPRFHVERRPFETRKAFERRAKEALRAFCSSSEDFLDVGRDHK